MLDSLHRYGEALAAISKDAEREGLSHELLASTCLGFACGILRREGMTREQVIDMARAIMLAGDALDEAPVS